MNKILFTGWEELDELLSLFGILHHEGDEETRGASLELDIILVALDLDGLCVLVNEHEELFDILNLLWLRG